MYVQCERCKAEYDFDDALVSERGTTVKCTNCGHQFKVRRAGGVPEDRWVVTRVDGEEVVLTSLKELQRAILAKRVAREDRLSRMGSPARQLGAIAELEPFFDEKRQRVSLAPEGARGDLTHPAHLAHPTHSRSTNVSVSSRPPPPPGAPLHPHLSEPPRRSELPPMRARTPTLRPPDLSGAVPPPAFDAPALLAVPSAPAVEDVAANVPEPMPVRRSTPPPIRERSEPPPLPPRRSSIGVPPIEMSSPLPPPTARRSLLSELDEHPRAGAQDVLRATPPPQRFLGWIVAVVVLGGAMIVGAFWIRPYLAAPASPVVGALDPRVAPLLVAGESALGEGDLATAQTNFDKASAFAERDPRVLADLARVANARADVPWLRQRLLPGESDAMKSNKVSLAELSLRAKKAAADALTAAPEDASALRVELDALRIHDEHDAARALAGRITGNVAAEAQPEVAYVLGALDLSELDPPWPEVIDHLLAATAGDGSAGRARAALVYALVRSGDTRRAREELGRLSSLPRPHPLLAELRAFTDRAVAAGDGGVPSPQPSGAARAAPRVLASAPVGEPPSSSTPPAGDPRLLLSQAEAAKQRRDFPRARALYDAVLAKNPADSEALAGLGDVSHMERDLGGAQAFYKRALAANPSFMPALVGLADVQWESGDRGVAQGSYKEIVDRFPEGSYPSYVRNRSEPPVASPSAPALPVASGLTGASPAPDTTGDPP